MTQQSTQWVVLTKEVGGEHQPSILVGGIRYSEEDTTYRIKGA